MNIRYLTGISILFLNLFLAGCSSPESRPTAAPAVITPKSLQSDLAVIQSIEPHLAKLDTEFAAVPLPAKEGRDYYNAEEIDLIEGLLFRFLAMQSSLWDIVNEYGGLQAKFPDRPLDARAEVLSLTATLLLASHTAFVVDQFADDPVAIRQFNETYYRSHIPFGTYDRMRESVTAPGMVDAVADARDLVADEMANPQSAIAKLAASDTGYASLLDQLPALHDTAEARLQQIDTSPSAYSEAEKTAREDARRRHPHLYAARAYLFKSISRLKNPTAHIIEFTDQQKQEIFDQLQPGDLILTYTAGYMSDVFIPGAFKHGITYIGSDEERTILDLDPEILPEVELYEPQKLATNLENSVLADGTQADMIEAVAEGVIFNDLEHIMDTHINRMLVLRPKLSLAEKKQFLVEVYSYLGDAYDFEFDFADASKQVCTEVIYRALNEKGGIDFELTVRAGHETLSADDIANYHLASANELFDFILLVETDPRTGKTALIFTGDEGADKLKTLMDSVKRSKDSG